jgi:hypothetical protein
LSKVLPQSRALETPGPFRENVSALRATKKHRNEIGTKAFSYGASKKRLGAWEHESFSFVASCPVHSAFNKKVPFRMRFVA